MFIDDDPVLYVQFAILDSVPLQSINAKFTGRTPFPKRKVEEAESPIKTR
jgi:hypothetical protein